MTLIARKIVMISIHAPTRGATILQTSSRRSSRYFNPRSYKRSDAHCSKSSCWRIYFNPRSYKRSDVRKQGCIWKDKNFNPRSYKRSDVHFLCDSHVNHVISIHAPTRGATMQRTSKRRDISISIHAPTRGATRCKSLFHVLEQFQSTLLQEERPSFSVFPAARSFISIHAPTRGATGDRKDQCFHKTDFNPRSYKRSDGSASASLPVAYIFQSTLLQEERRHVVDVRNIILKISIHAPTRGATSCLPLHFLE